MWRRLDSFVCLPNSFFSTSNHSEQIKLLESKHVVVLETKRNKMMSLKYYNIITKHEMGYNFIFNC